MRDRPNVVIFMADQLRADAIGASGNAVVRTPNVDALASRGTRFSQAFVQHSACSQSRISSMTGWYPHVAGHRTLDNLLKPWEPNLLATLRDAGYHVVWPGLRGDTFAPGVTAASTDFFGYRTRPDLGAVAAHHEARYPPGHRLRHAFYLGCVDGGVDFDEATVRTAIELLEEGLPEPFLLYVPLFAPHPPFAVEEPWFSLHDRRDMPAPVGPGRGKARFLDELRSRGGLEALADTDWAEIKATYYGMVARLDDQLGRLLVALDRAGCGARTITWFTTDHGEYLGDFGVVEKWPDRRGKGLRRPRRDGRSPANALRARGNGAGTRPPAGFPYDLKTTLVHERPELCSRAIAIRTPEWLIETSDVIAPARDPRMDPELTEGLW